VEPSIGIEGACVIRSHEQQSYRDLWASVLTIAAQDLAKRSRRNYALDWLNGDVVAPGSFAWVCRILDLDAEAVRQKMLDGKGRPKPHGRNGRAARH